MTADGTPLREMDESMEYTDPSMKDSVMCCNKRRHAEKERLIINITARFYVELPSAKRMKGSLPCEQRTKRDRRKSVNDMSVQRQEKKD